MFISASFMVSNDLMGLVCLAVGLPCFWEGREPQLAAKATYNAKADA
jgi:hypothetical protein